MLVPLNETFPMSKIYYDLQSQVAQILGQKKKTVEEKKTKIQDCQFLVLCNINIGLM